MKTHHSGYSSRPLALLYRSEGVGEEVFTIPTCAKTKIVPRKVVSSPCRAPSPIVSKLSESEDNVLPLGQIAL